MEQRGEGRGKREGEDMESADMIHSLLFALPPLIHT